MANKFITMLQIRRILQLLVKGKKRREIATELDISVNTLKKYDRLFKCSGLTYSELLICNEVQLLSIVDPTNSSDHKPARLQELTKLIPDFTIRLQKTHITRELLWEEYIQTNKNGYSYSQFCEHLSRYMIQNKAVMHLVHIPGDVLQIDFAGDKLSYTGTDGKPILCPVLVCCMPYSSYCYAEALVDMTQMQLISSLNRCLEYLGGVPKNICCDNLKQVVNKADKYEPVFSELMDQFALHYNVSLTATRVVKPRDKASVERHVGIVYSYIYARIEQEQFFSLNELNFRLINLLNELNHKPMQRKNHTRHQCFEKEEQHLLLPLPTVPFEIKFQTKGKVQYNYHVILGKDWHNYSVPYQHIGKEVKIIYDSRDVEIYLGLTRIAIHRRNYERNGFTTNEEHRPDNHKTAMMIQQYTPDYFLEKAKLIGPDTYKVIENIINSKFFSQQNFKSCLGILHLETYYGKDRLEKACGLALQGLEINYRTIKNILKNSTDKLDESTTAKDVTNQFHQNIRGKDIFTELFMN